MKIPSSETSSALTAWAILPSENLRGRVVEALGAGHAFQILAEERSYPADSTLDIRIRQLQPDVVLIDVEANPAAAGATLQTLSAHQPPVLAIALDGRGNAAEVVRWLRSGASDFLSAPFALEAQNESAERIRRLRGPEGVAALTQTAGILVAFSSTKSGAGASSLAAQTAIALAEGGRKRVLLMDLDYASASTTALMGGSGEPLSIASALADLDLALGDWPHLVSRYHGVDLLAAPAAGLDSITDFHRLHELIDFSRSLYDWVIVDLPSVFQRLSLFVLSEADWGLLVTTPELPSLHFTRRAFEMLRGLGFDFNRIRLLENQTDTRGQISAADMAKILNCRLFHSLPRDQAWATASGMPGPNTSFGKSVRTLANKIAAEQTSLGSPSVPGGVFKED